MFGIAPEWLLYDGRPIASSLVLPHDDDLARLAASTPEALETAVVAGDPAFDRMLRSVHLRDRYRSALGLTRGQKLVTVSSTWWRRSLMGAWPSLLRELLACLPVDEYRVAAVLHPNIWHGHGPWQVHTWLADCVRAGLLLVPPDEGWQAPLLAADVVVGDHGATTCYAAGLGRPVLLASFPEDDVAAGSAADVLGHTSPRLHRHAPLRAQLEAALRSTPAPAVRDALTSCPGESAARLRTVFYRHLDLVEPAKAAVVPVISPESLALPAAPRRIAHHVVCALEDEVELTRYPADVTGRATDTHLDDTFLVVHEDHAQRTLLDSAAVVLVEENPADALRRHPGATLAATGSRHCVVHLRDGRHLTLHAPDPAVAAALVYAWLREGRPLSTLPQAVTVVARPRRYDVRVGSPVAG